MKLADRVEENNLEFIKQIWRKLSVLDLTNSQTEKAETMTLYPQTEIFCLHRSVSQSAVNA